jgi:hypothetical protein
LLDRRGDGGRGGLVPLVVPGGSHPLMVAERSADRRALRVTQVTTGRCLSTRP